MKEPFGGLILNVAFRMLVPFTLTYGVYIYCNTDNGTDFSAKTVNGISYTWNGSSTVTGSSGWGATGTTDQLIEGTNVLYVDGQTASRAEGIL